MKDKKKRFKEDKIKKGKSNPKGLKNFKKIKDIMKKSKRKKEANSKEKKDNIPEEYNEEVEDQKEHEEKEDRDEELDKIKREFKKLKSKAEAPQFPRIESKPGFASEVINVPSNQKVANLEDEQISDLLRKRRFMNMCNEYGWGVVAKMAMLTIADIENYSLSKEGFLVDNVLNERQKQTVYSESHSSKKEKKRRSDKER